MSKKTLYEYFKGQGMNDYGVCGLLGNIQRESGFKANNLQETGNKKLGMTDEEYTAAVDNGTYSRDKFRKDGHGYGLVQHTWHTRKAKLYDYAKKKKVSIGNEEMQREFIVRELKGYKSVWKTLCNATSVKEASDKVMLEYENPADQSESAKKLRTSYGEAIYNEFCAPKTYATVEIPVLKKGAKGAPIGALQILLNGLGYDCGAVDESFGSKTLAAVEKFQKENSLVVDGSVGKATWTALLN